MRHFWIVRCTDTGGYWEFMREADALRFTETLDRLGYASVLSCSCES